MAYIRALAGFFYNSVYAIENMDDADTIKGHVILELIVTREGKVRDSKVIKSVPAGAFDEAAVKAAKRLRFKPPTENGEPVEATITKAMSFKMSAAEFKANKASNDGLKHLRNGNYESALSSFSTAIENAPGNGQYFDLRGQVYYELENYQKAVEDYSKAIEKEPDMADAYFDRGEALRKLGKYKEAVEDYSKAIGLDKNYMLAYNSRAVSYNKLKDTGSMCFDLKKACELGDCRGIEAARRAEKCK